MAQQPFYGALSSVTPVNENIVLFTGDVTSGNNTITNIAVADPSYDLSLIEPGQIINDIFGNFPSTPTITNVAGTTITVDVNASSTSTGGYYGNNPPSGTYFIPSASLFDPTNVLTVNDITGSDDTDYDGSTPIYAFIGQAGTNVASPVAIPGRFHEYKITKVITRDPLNAKFSFYIEWNEDGTEASSGDKLYRGSNQALAIASLTAHSELAPIFNSGLTGMSDVTLGSDVAGYQIAINNFLDDIVQTDVYYTGSLVNKNNANINFSGSGVEVETSGSDGILVTITGGDPETYSNSDPTPLDFPNGDDPSIPAGTTFVSKSFVEMMDLMLYPELNPTLTNPSNTLTMSPSGLREIGETISTITLSATFNRGSISPAYGTDGYRSGLPNTYVYTGTGTSNNSSTSLTDTETVSSYTVTSGVQSWTGAVSYDEGDQPLTSKGNDYDSPLSAGTTSAITRTITGVYPVFATTSTLGTLTKQSLQTMTTLIQVSMVAEDGGGDKQTIDIPDAWSTISGLQQFNTLSNSWDTISLSTFSTSAITKTIQGNTVNYTRYTHNGGTIGARQLRFTV